MTPALACPVRYTVWFVNSLERISNENFSFIPSFSLILSIGNNFHSCLHPIDKQMSSFTLDIIKKKPIDFWSDSYIL